MALFYVYIHRSLATNFSQRLIIIICGQWKCAYFCGIHQIGELAICIREHRYIDQDIVFAASCKLCDDVRFRTFGLIQLILLLNCVYEISVYNIIQNTDRHWADFRLTQAFSFSLSLSFSFSDYLSWFIPTPCVSWHVCFLTYDVSFLCSHTRNSYTLTLLLAKANFMSY